MCLKLGFLLVCMCKYRRSPVITTLFYTTPRL